MKFKHLYKITAMVSLLTGTAIAAQPPIDLASSQLLASRSGVDSNYQPANRTTNTVRGGSVLFSEDFQTQADPLNPVLPAGWVVVNVDGLTPAASVSQFTDAWIAVDNGESEFAAASTSWYSPAGQSDDWLITPAISVLSHSVLTWKGWAPDAAYPDGYEVYISDTTQDVAGCSANAPVLTVPAELQEFTEREINIATAGYSNEDIYACFRNTSFDQFILQIDDVMVSDSSANDVAIESVLLPEYTQYPVFLSSYQMPVGVTITNNGFNAQSDIYAEVGIEIDMVFDGSNSGVFPGPLLTGETTAIDLSTYPTSVMGMYSFFYEVALDGVIDETPADNVFDVLEVIEVTADVMSRDTGPTVLALGVSSIEEAYLGNMFEFPEDVAVDSVLFTHGNSNCDVGNTEACGLDGESMQVDVFPIDGVSGLPGELIASSEVYVVPATPGGYSGLQVEVAFTGGLNLPAGQYVFAVKQPARTVSTFGTTNMALEATAERFTAGTGWGRITSGGVPGAWTFLEDFGFANTLKVSVKLVNPDVIFKSGFE